MLQEFRCCSKCLVNAICTTPCEKYNKILYPIEVLFRIVNLLYQFSPDLLDRFIRTILGSFLGVSLIVYYFLLVGFRPPTFTIKSKDTILVKRADSWLSHV
jgi:hypothetical protein